MKKCASCTKDLPDAALHCVFCGAKQPPAPATPGGMAKTAFGAYSASEMMDHLKTQQANRGGPAPRPAAPSPAPSPYAATPRPTPAAPPQPGYSAIPAPPAPVASAYQPPSPSPARGHNVPQASAAAPTMMVAPGGGPAPGNYAARPMGPMGAPAPAPMAPLVMPTPAAPMQQPPMAYAPPMSPPYLASQTAARAGRPIEPWKDSLRLMMLVWGGALIAAFVTPLSIDPLLFNWDAIIHADGTQKLPPLVMAAVGLLSIVIALIPTSPVPRGLIAGLLGLAGVAVPIVIVQPPWQLLVPTAGMILLIPGLLLRQEYRDGILPRILVTLGVLATLLVFVLPEHGSIPIVELFKLMLDMPGASKIIVILLLAQLAIVVFSLLAWLPAPSSAAGNVLAWLLILWPVISTLTLLIASGTIADVLTKTPYGVVAWVAGGGALGGKEAALSVIGLGVGYAVLIGYGWATVIGKKLE